MNIYTKQTGYMTRKLTIILEDVDSANVLSGITTIDEINYMYDVHELNGCTEILLQLNNEMNKLLGEDIKISIPAIK